jgi:hypothetical protein
MKSAIILMSLLTFGCTDKSNTIEEVPIRMDKSDPDFKNNTQYVLDLITWDSTSWFLSLSGYSNYIDTSLTENGDTVVSLVHASLSINQNKDFKILSYDEDIIEIDSGLIIPKKSGDTKFIYQTPQGIDTAIIKIDNNQTPKLSGH